MRTPLRGPHLKYTIDTSETRSPHGRLKLMILVAVASMPTSNERTTEFPAYFAPLRWKHKTLVVDGRQKISADKSTQTSTFLEIRNSNE